MDTKIQRQTDGQTDRETNKWREDGEVIPIYESAQAAQTYKVVAFP